MQTNENKSGSTGYWIATILLCLGMTAGGIVQLIRLKFNVDGIIHLGYPSYVLTIFGIWKLLGVTALLAPGWLLLKEWAYAGFFFLMTGAVISHIVSGDSFIQWLGPFIYAILTVVSWYLRPASRKLEITNLRTGI